MTQGPPRPPTSSADRPHHRQQHRRPPPREPGSQPRGTSPEALALLAAWVEDPSHLSAGLTRFDAGARDPELCSRLATISGLLASRGPGAGLSRTSTPAGGGRGWVPANGLRATASAGDVRERFDQAGTSGARRRRAAWNQPGAVEGPDSSAGYLRHPGVEKLLIEYYKMVEAARAGPGVGAAKAPGSSKNLLVRWGCPQPPEFLELHRMVKRSQAYAALGSTCIMHLLPLLLPLWLCLLRHLLGTSVFSCILSVGLGLLFFRTAEVLHCEGLQKLRQGPEGKIRAFRIPPNGKMPPESQELLAALAKCKAGE
eukprot:evm.model.scf_1022.5 EVM.evm.TU.scf_1022.5   scf_1022:49817-54398(+)